MCLLVTVEMLAEWLPGGALHWVASLGGMGLVLLAIVDNSIFPVPGSMDALTIVLAASNRSLWFYYGAMATVGAISGGYITYRIGRKGGKATIERKISTPRAAKIYQKFEQGGSLGMVVASLLPPPIPFVPMLLAAGAMRHDAKKFLTALALGRGVRYFPLAFLGRVYGPQIIRFLRQSERPVLWTLVALVAAGALLGLGWYFYPRKNRDAPHRSRPRRAA